MRFYNPRSKHKERNRNFPNGVALHTNAASGVVHAHELVQLHIDAVATQLMRQIWYSVTVILVVMTAT